MSTQIADNLNIPDDQWITASVWGTGNITGNRSQTLIANSVWSQVNGGLPFGTSFGSLVTVRNYRGGTSEIWNGYGGFASTYCGTESQSWNDPSIASYDARNLNGTRFTPHNPPGVPAPYPFSTTSKTFVMPPSLVEDGEAATVEEREESAIGRFLWSLVPGSSLVDAYRDYQKGDYVSAGLNGVSGLSDLLSLGTITKAKSSLKLFVGFMKVRVKDSLADEAANQAGVAVAERLGPEAGFVTQIIVSATLSKNVSQQNKTQLGFANNGSGDDFQKAIQIPKSLPDRLVISGKSLGKRMKQRVLELGLDPSDPNVRQTFRSRIDRIFLNTDEKRANFYRGQGKKGLEGVVLLYRRGHDVLVLSLEGGFITLLVGGVNSQRWIPGVVIP
jgi:hypothetical protein